MERGLPRDRVGRAMEGVIIVIIVINVLRIAMRGKTKSPRRTSVGFWIGCGKVAQVALLMTISSALDPLGQMLATVAYIVPLAPSFVFKQLVVPLGLPRITYWLARGFGPVGTMYQGGAGAAVFGALALARKHPPREGPTAQAVAWLTQRINGTESERMRGAGVVAGGLLAALRGDRHRARCLLLMADTLPHQRVPWSTRAVARDWLVADAARSGNWREVIRLSRRGEDGFRWSHLMGGIAERLTRLPGAPRDWRLWLSWLWAPRRRATFGLLRRALAVPRVPTPETVVAAAAEPAPVQALPDALADVADVLINRFARDGASLASRVHKVDAALDRPELRSLVQQRLTALDAHQDTDTIVSTFRTRLVELLVPVIEECPSLASGPERGPIIEQAADRVRSRLLRDIEAQCRDCNERQKREVSLDALAEWETWAVMRESANRVLELDPGSELTLFRAMYVSMCNYAVFQHNKCKRIVLAHDIFAWLARHAKSDAAAVQLLNSNMLAGKP